MMKGQKPGPKLISDLFHRIGIVYNPFAGGLRGDRMVRLHRAVRTLEAAGSRVELFATRGPNHGGETARQAAAKGCTVIFAAGGDGTINEVINGLVCSDTPFGVLPSGTANVLANELGLAERPDLAARQLLRAKPVRVTVGRVEQPHGRVRHFLMMAGVGLDAQIVYHLDSGLKQRFGKLSYWHGGLTQLTSVLPRFRTVIGHESFSATFTLITRVRNYGGDFEIARGVKLTDDDFEIVTFSKDTWQDYVQFLGGVMFNQLKNVDGVQIRRASRVEVLAPDDARVFIQTDGEVVGRLPATVSTVPRALTMLVPARYLAREPIPAGNLA